MEPINWQVELDHVVTEFFVDPISNQSTRQTNIGPIDWQLESDQEVTELGPQICHCWTNQHVAPINWHVEMDQGATEFHVGTDFATVEPINILHQSTGK